MPSLNWIGREAVLNHHNEIPYRLLRFDDQRSVGDKDCGNLLIEGDNLEALKALLPYYGGQVKCIYIDPPYNTGKEEWKYNDAVNSPEMRDWLGKVVKGEAEDLTRHDKWLCMMYPRLSLLRHFLREDGVIFISIDDTEFASLRLLLDEIFGRGNFIGTIVWRNVTDNNPTNITTEHEYVLCYGRDKTKLQKEWKATSLPAKELLMKIGYEFIEKYQSQEQRQTAYTKWYRQNRPYIWPFQDYKFIDVGGIYTGSRSVHNPGKEGYRYDVIHPNGKPCTQPLMGYRFPPETMQKLLSEDQILFGEDETKLIELKIYVKDYRFKLSSLFELDGRVGTNEIKDIFPENKRPFDFPKPTGLIQELLSFTTEHNDIILDSFAGSGTTGQSVLQLNNQDGGSRRFILIEMEPTIAAPITAERLRRIINGYDNVNSLGGGFRFATLGPTLFDETGAIQPEVTFDDLAAHIFFAETGRPLPAPPRKGSPFLGQAGEVAYYLFYNGVKGGSVLDAQNLKQVRHSGQAVVYADSRTVSPETLKMLNITFKQIPYQVQTR